MRIPVNVNSGESIINVNLEQEFDNLEVLSLKITNSDAYNRMCSDFGTIVGRVMLNSGFGIQNAKVSIFIPISDIDLQRDEITQLYPFQTVNDTFPNGVRYNLLPRIRNLKNPSHRAVGNFPDESDFSHYPQYMEIMEKYYKFTTITNQSGDYMIFGVPLGQQNIIMDFDVFDTNSFEISANDLVEQSTLASGVQNLQTLINNNAAGNLIQVPGFINDGNGNYEIDVVTNLDSMPNIFHQVKQINVSPFWGDSGFCDIGITRCDFTINFTYTPTAVFFGYIQSPSNSYTINPDYNFSNIFETKPLEIPAYDNSLGYLTGDLFPFQKMQIVVYSIDNITQPIRNRIGVFDASYYNGVFRLTLPMYMDYYITNEYGDLVSTTDTKNGIATKGYYSFEIYDTDDRWTGRRNAWGYYNNALLPGIRIPCNNSGDPNLGGWLNTGALFEYDIINKKRKFYTIKSTYQTSDKNNILNPGNYVGYFPNFNPNKSDAFWNFPLTLTNVINYNNPSIIGSVIVPRFNGYGDLGSQANNSVSILTNTANGTISIANRLLSVPNADITNITPSGVSDCEKYLGIGVQYQNGLNFGNVFTTLFDIDEFYWLTSGATGSTGSAYAEVPTWNYGDNSTNTFIPSLFAIQMSQVSGSTANEYKVQPAYSQVVSLDSTFGVFINSVQASNQIPVMDIEIYDITNDLPGLIKDSVYSSYNKGNINNGIINPYTLAQTTETDQTEIYVEENNVVYSSNGSILNTIIDNNAYNGNFYYFGLWFGANALYDIQTNYEIS